MWHCFHQEDLRDQNLCVKYQDLEHKFNRPNAPGLPLTIRKYQRIHTYDKLQNMALFLTILLQGQTIYSVSHMDKTLPCNHRNFCLSPLAHFPIKTDSYRTMALEIKLQDLLYCQIENDNTRMREAIN